MAENESEVAHVTDYFANVGVVALEITGDGIQIGDVLHFRGHTTDLLVEVSSMQIDRQPVKHAVAGQNVGIKVPDRVRVHDKVYKVKQE